MPGDEQTDSDSHVEQLANQIETGGRVHSVLRAVAEGDGGLSAAEIADDLGWTEDEVREVIGEMEDRGLIGGRSRQLYVGSTDMTVEDAAEEMGVTEREAHEHFASLVEMGLMRTVQISDDEHVICLTADGGEAVQQLHRGYPRFG